VTVVESRLWQDASELPNSLSDSLDRADGHAELARAIGNASISRLVLSGNGASWYVANAAWLAAIETDLELDVVTVPAGILAGGTFRWRKGDFLLAISSSGSLRDLLEAAEHPGLPRPFGLITAEADSPLARSAGVNALVTVKHQRAVTHSQAYLGSAVVLLDLIGRLADDQPLRRAVAAVPDVLARQLAEAPGWSAQAVAEIGDTVPRAAIVFGSGPSWAAAQEAALLLKEVAAIQTEGVETREGATTGMYALDDAHLVLALAQDRDRLVEEATAVCEGRGARVFTAPWVAGTDRRLGFAGHFLYPLALSIELALTQGLSPDQPPWYAAYKATARRTPLSEEPT
jgi:glucosamine--fructose-6-phosphate aminotransferase (isomerizing)